MFILKQIKSFIYLFIRLHFCLGEMFRVVFSITSDICSFYRFFLLATFIASCKKDNEDIFYERFENDRRDPVCMLTRNVSYFAALNK